MKIGSKLLRASTNPDAMQRKVRLQLHPTMLEHIQHEITLQVRQHSVLGPVHVELCWRRRWRR